MSTLVRIGEFSRLTHISVKALRHYQEVGVLAPREVDPRTGYRQYALEQVAHAQLVRRLRALDMPLDQIRDVLAAPSPERRNDAIAQHLVRLEGKLERTRSMVASLREFLAGAAPEGLAIERVYESDGYALTLRDQVALDEVEAWSATTFARLEREVGALGLSSAGPSGTLFESDFFTEGAGWLTAFVPIAEAVAGPNEGPIRMERVPGGHYARAVHAGAYRDLDRTYGRVGAWVNARALGAPGCCREHYVTGPSEVARPADYRTQLLWPIVGPNPAPS